MAPTDSTTPRQTLPHNLEAERAILGAILICPDADAFNRAVAVGLSGDMFYRDAHRAVWRALERLRDSGAALDLVTLRHGLGDELETVGGAAYIAGLVDGVPRSTNVEDYAGIVVGSHRRRQIIFLGNRLSDSGGDVDHTRKLAGELTALVADGETEEGEIMTLAEIGSTEPADTLARGLLWRAKMGVLHGGPGSGKTTLTAGVLSALTTGGRWMGHETVDGGCDVLLLSGEDVDTLRARIDQWGGDAARVHVWSSPRVDGLAAAVERFGAAAVVVDSLQSLARGLGLDMNADTEAGGLVRALSRLARDTGAAVLCLHHEPWAQGRERGSTAGETQGRVKGSGEIAAAADYTLRCSTDMVTYETTIDPTKCRHSINAERLVFLLDPGAGFTPAPDDGPRDTDSTRRTPSDRILIHLARASVDAAPSRRDLTGALGMRHTDGCEAVAGLVNGGLLASVKAGRRQGVKLTEAGRQAGERLIHGATTDTVPKTGTGSGASGTGSGDTVPLTGGERERYSPTLDRADVWCDLMQALEAKRPVLPTRGRGYAVVTGGDHGCILFGPDTSQALREHGAPPVLVEWARDTEAQFWPSRAA